MNAMFLFFAWCVLLAVSWPVAILALLLAPVVWLVTLPLRLVGLCVRAAFALIGAILFLPARLLGHRPSH